MCTTNEEDINEVIAQLDSILMELTELTKKIDVNIDVSAMTTEDPDVVTGCVNVGDYVRYKYRDGTCWWNYRPKVIKGGGYDTSLYQDHVDPAKIVSFTMPPKDGSNPDL